MKNIEIQELEKKILHHKEKYYAGHAEISDEEFDKLEDRLKKLDPQNPVLSIVGFKQDDSGAKVEHQKKMLSLEKTYDQNDLEKWIGEESVLSVFKIDGSSCSLLYENGHLAMAKTRGDGQYGENITKKAMFLAEIPKYIAQKESIEVRGEVFCREKNFIHLAAEMKSLGLEEPSSQRNIVAGLLGRKENVQLARFLSFKAFDLISDKKFTKEHQKLDELKNLGFIVPDYQVHQGSKSATASINEAKEFVENGDYLIDGLVFVYEDLNLHRELGETSHHPKYKMAFKFQGETKKTSIESLEWNVSRNGILTPVAIVVPVELSGAMIGRVTLHNYGMVAMHELKSGDEIEIIRSGEVIPKFLSVVKKSNNKFIVPEKCPSCHSGLAIEDIWLLCKNEGCPAKVKEEILNYIHKSGIEDLSDKRLEEMMNKGLIKSIDDLYRVSKEDFLTLDKVKEKLATKMFENIQKSKEQNLAQFISAIGVEGVSITKSEKIISQGFNTLEKVQSLTLEQMLKIDGFAEKSSEDFLRSINKKKDLIHHLIKLGVNVKADEISTGEGNLLGLKFCITGELSSPRGEIEKLIKKNGGVMVSSVSKNTNYLVTNDEESSSSKFVKAKTLGIPILNEKALLKLIEE